MKSPVIAAGLSLALAAVATPRCKADLLSPTTPVAGVSQAQLSARWWNWALSFPAGTNPIDDPTGQFAYLGDQGPVFFLGGSISPDPVVRSVTVRENQVVFFPLINAFNGYRPGDPDFPAGGDATILQEARDFFGAASGLFLTVDGAPAPLPPGTSGLNNFYQEVLFDLNVPVNNVFGAPPGLYRAASVGQWVALTLPPGTHQISFGGTTTPGGVFAGLPSFSQNISYSPLLVTSTPEPATVATFAALALGAFGLRRRKRVMA